MTESMKKITCVSLIAAAALVACVPSAGAAESTPTLRSSWSKSSWTIAPATEPRSRFRSEFVEREQKSPKPETEMEIK